MSLFESASAFAVRHFSRDRLLALRAAYHAGRTRLYPLLRTIYGTFDAAALRAHLERELGSFEILMVHSSINNMQPTYTGTPLDLVRMLIEFCGPQRTLVMPAFYFGDPAIGGAGKTFLANPRFDVRRTPSQMGLATELFRRSRGVVLSRHPIYRVAALGPLARDLTQGHELASGCGKDSPFDYMTKRDTLIIGIGKPFEVLTHVHHAEAIMGSEFPVPRSKGKPVPMTLVDGTLEIEYELQTGGLMWKRDMWRLRKIMSPDTLREWSFHHVPLFATRAADVTASLVDAARRGITLYVPPGEQAVR
jgi:aminoglycoside 3-N-acetyltransferase